MHLHRRNGWDDFTEGVASIANQLNPFSDSDPTLAVQVKANGPSTVYKTIYTTMEPTFAGAIGGYSTVVSDESDTTTTSVKAQAVATATSTRAKEQPKTTAAALSASVATSDSTSDTDTSLPESLVPTSSEVQSSLALATDDPTTPTTTLVKATSTGLTGTNADAAVSASSTASASSSSSDTSGAAKAGIAIGVLAGILVVGLLVYFLFSKRRKQMEQQRVEDDEKINGAFAGVAAVARRASVQTNHTSRTNPNAPRLSLRPVTQFMPNFGERRSSKGAAIALSLTTPHETHTQINRPAGGSPWERSMTSQSENPFSDNAERSGTSFGQGPTNPFNAPENVVGVASTTNSPTESSPIGAAAVGAAAGVAIARKQSIQRKELPKALDLTKASNLEPIPAPSASPAATEFSFTSVAPGQSPGPSNSANAIAAAGGPPATTVHRVQLDFKPTLEDEMELRAGQLVRLLHEYDDGWTLCIRLDRSQQGVVPRTCLSTRPVKPRAAGGPPGTRNGPRGPGPNSPPGQRTMTSQGGFPYPRPESPMRPMTAGGPPQSPAGMRQPQSPAGMRRPESPAGMPRPQSPAGMRRGQSPGPLHQSPAPRQRGYSNASANGGRPGPGPGLGPSPMNPASSPNQYRGPSQGPVGRKPVPGQAY